MLVSYTVVSLIIRQLEENRDLENKFRGKNFVFDERRGNEISKILLVMSSKWEILVTRM